MAADELFHRFQGQAAGFGHAPGLHQGRFRGNVGIKAASRSGQHIHGQHAFGQAQHLGDPVGIVDRRAQKANAQPFRLGGQTNVLRRQHRVDRSA